MIDFEVDWSRWFAPIEQPDGKKISNARKEAERATKGANEVYRYIEDDDTERTMSEFVSEVENAISDLMDAQEETEARFKDAEFATEQAQETLAWFLNHHKAVLVENRLYKSESNENRPPEVVSWCDHNCKGDFQTFDVERHVAIVFFDDTDRLHCKLRFG